ncbi:MAG: class I SAM-dependent methyltransferase [Polyangiaceae bacterium]|nr:class I SAM-dependent methyltransferase [Polyangiaceae bacterium]
MVVSKPMQTPLDLPEISDLVVDYDPDTLARQRVKRDDVLDRFTDLKMQQAKAIVQSWPHSHGMLDDRFVDGVLLRSHLELQRLSEEFQQGARVKRLLVPVIAALREAGVRPPYRAVDIGCGLGYVVRWLSAHGQLGEDVVLMGCDYNAVLVKEAAALAQKESLTCSFAVANAFLLTEPATVFLSTGAVHHFRGKDLDRFFAAQAAGEALAFLHTDTAPSWLAPIGSRLFHNARMREPLARHDGVLSAVRAHSAHVLGRAASLSCKEFWLGVFDGKRSLFPVLRVLQTLIGARGALGDAVKKNLGPLAARVERV